MAQDENSSNHRELRNASDTLFTRNLRVPIQCVENPEGQNGCVIFENRSYRLLLLDDYIEDHGHPNLTHHETLRVPIQCEENPQGQNGHIILENVSYRLPVLDVYIERSHQNSTHGNHVTQQNDTVQRIPIQCEENPEGQNGCVIFDSRSYGLPQGHRSPEHHETHQNDTSLRVSVQCQEDQHVLHGLVEFANFFYTIDMQPRVEENGEDEEIHEDEDFCNNIQNLID